VAGAKEGSSPRPRAAGFSEKEEWEKLLLYKHIKYEFD
jgi:hypothetical protein